jgi:hypothetical protein
MALRALKPALGCHLNRPRWKVMKNLAVIVTLFDVLFPCFFVDPILAASHKNPAVFRFAGDSPETS